jgi:hypothetical protein
MNHRISIAEFSGKDGSILVFGRHDGTEPRERVKVLGPRERQSKLAPSNEVAEPSAKGVPLGRGLCLVGGAMLALCVWRTDKASDNGTRCKTGQRRQTSSDKAERMNCSL